MKWRYVILPLLGLGISGSLWLNVGTPHFGARPQFRPATPIAMAIQFASDRTTVTNESDCEQVISILSHARAGRNHFCPAIGKIVVTYADGATNVIALQIGHNWTRREYVMNGKTFVLSSRQFSLAMERAGLSPK